MKVDAKIVVDLTMINVDWFGRGWKGGGMNIVEIVMSCRVVCQMF